MFEVPRRSVKPADRLPVSPGEFAGTTILNTSVVCGESGVNQSGELQIIVGDT